MRFASAQTPTRVMSGYAATSGNRMRCCGSRATRGLFEKNGPAAQTFAFIRSGSTMASNPGVRRDPDVADGRSGDARRRRLPEWI